MKGQCIRGMKFTTNIIIACIIIHCSIAHNGPCINGECTLKNYECYNNQCYEVVGDCDEKKQCEHEDSKCVDTVTKTNICIWLKTLQEDDDVTVPITSTSSAETTTITTEICQDKAKSGKPSDCPLHCDLCNEPVYKELMKDQCPKTCGFCGSGSSTTYTPSTCEDKKGDDGKSNCKDVKDLCQIPLYMPLIFVQCPRTCGLC